MVRRSTYSYRAFGLNISSEIELSELLPASGKPDVFIRMNKISGAYKEGCQSDYFWKPTPNYFFLYIYNIGKYLVKGGNSIEFDPEGNGVTSELRVFLLGSCLGVILLQRGVLPLHASGIATAQGCVLFAGETGAGKSTLATAFLKKGYQFIADDICAISLNSHKSPIVFPAYPQIKLKQDSADILKIDTRNLDPVKSDLNKFRYSVTKQIVQDELPVHKIFFLIKNDSSQVAIKKIIGTEKIFNLIRNTYRSELIDGLKLNKEHFVLCREIGQNLSANLIEYQKNPLRLDSLVQIIQDDFYSI